MSAPKQILALVGDLFFAVRVADVIRGLGHQPIMVDTATALAEGLAAKPDLVLLDLARVEDWEASVRAMRADPELAAIRILAFGSHMNVEAQQRGRAAGVDRVVANSKFSSDLPVLIEQNLA